MLFSHLLKLIVCHFTFSFPTKVKQKLTWTSCWILSGHPLTHHCGFCKTKEQHVLISTAKSLWPSAEHSRLGSYSEALSTQPLRWQRYPSLPNATGTVPSICQMYPSLQMVPFTAECRRYTTLHCQMYPSLPKVRGTIPFTAKCTFRCQRYPSLPNARGTAPFTAKGILQYQTPEAQYPSLPKVSFSTKCQTAQYPSLPKVFVLLLHFIVPQSPPALVMCNVNSKLHISLIT